METNKSDQELPSKEELLKIGKETLKRLGQKYEPENIIERETLENNNNGCFGLALFLIAILLIVLI